MGLAATTVITQWKAQSDRCLRYLPDGTEETLYGEDRKTTPVKP